MSGPLADMYKKKLREIDDIVKLIDPGSRIFIGSGAAEPQLLIEMLIEQGNKIADHQTINVIELGTTPYTEAVMSRPFKQNAFFIG